MASGTLQIVIPTSGADSSEDKTGVSASPPRLPSYQGLATGSVTSAVTTSVIYRQRVEDEAAASSSHSQDDRLSGRQSLRAGQGPGPLRTGCQESEETVENNSAGA